MFGVVKSPATIKKLQKLVYVYEADTQKLIGCCVRMHFLQLNVLNTLKWGKIL